ncbi:hypothetical protein ACP70R_025680 [Stipagrostis hirtigluma subsp. patula]
MAITAVQELGSSALLACSLDVVCSCRSATSQLSEGGILLLIAEAHGHGGGGRRFPSANHKIAVVTGGNKGIGLEVCRQLASNGITVVLTARDEARGVAAIEKLRGLGLSDVTFHQLDVTDAPSIACLAEFLKTRFGKLDILVNNAAVCGLDYVHRVDATSIASEEMFRGMDMSQRLEWVLKLCRETCDAGKEALRTNYYGTKQVIEALLPLLRASSDGRIVNVSSEFGQLRVFHNEELKEELSDIDKLTEERLDEVVDTFARDMEAGVAEARGWPVSFSAYKVSKAALNAHSRILARRHPTLRVNCVHPGFVSTDMTMHSGMLTPQEGARRVVAVTLLPAAAGGPTGAYFAERQEAPFV